MISKKLFRNIFLYTIFIGSFGYLCYWLWQNPAYNPAAPQIIKDPNPEIEIVFKDVIVKGRKKGEEYWTVYSNKVEIEKNSSWVFFKEEPNGEFYNIKKKGENRLRTFTWEADLAEYDTDTEDLNMIGNVEVITDDKDVITTEKLSWDNINEKVSSNTRTKIVGHKGHPIILSDKLEGDVKMDVFDLEGNVEITTEIDDEQKM